MAVAVSFAIVRTAPSITVDELSTRVSTSLVDGYKRVLDSQVLVILIIKHQSRNYSDSIKQLVSSIDRNIFTMFFSKAIFASLLLAMTAPVQAWNRIDKNNTVSSSRYKTKWGE